jgi:Na+/H+-dicarboxylate symporter
VPANPVRAAAEEQFLPLILFTVVFALALTRITPERREGVGRFFRGVADTMFVLIRWVLWFTPVGVFALAFALAARTGLGGAGALIYFVVLLSALLLLFTLVLYPVGTLAGGAPTGAFVRALIPAQAVAVSTRSSLACLPSLMDGAERELRLAPAVAGFVLPLSVSTFKVHRTISDVVELLFLARLYGIELGPGQVATFFVTALILSFSAVGIPSGGYSFKTLPAFLAVGIPLEGVAILKAVDVIPDIFKTLLNVTGDMTAATILARVGRVKAGLGRAVAG